MNQMKANLLQHLLHLLIALFKHQAKAWLGEGTLEAVGGTLAKISSEELQAHLDHKLKEEATADQLLKAVRRAEEYFRCHCGDRDLVQALTLDFGTLPSVQEALTQLPNAMDLDSVESALREALTRDLGCVLTPAQIDRGARLYAEALQAALGTLQGFAQPVVLQILLQVRQEQREGFAALQRQLERILELLAAQQPLSSGDQDALRKALVTGQAVVLGDVAQSVIIISSSNIVSLTADQAQALRGQVTLPGDLPPGSRLPLLRNALFTGRDEPLRRLVKALLAPDGKGQEVLVVTQAIAGMGGMGKTQLAVEFAYRYGYRFRGVHWLDLSNPDLLDEQIAACGEAMGLPRIEGQEQAGYVAQVLKVWETDGPRLLLLDGLEDIEAAQETILPRLRHSNLRLLLTTRRQDWPPHLGLDILRLDEFTPEESRAFLRRYLPPGRATDDELDTLADRLGHLPLALDLAGRYLHRQPYLTVGEYLQRLENVFDHPSMRDWQPQYGSPTQHNLNLWTTFELSWGQVKGEDARRLFIFCGFLAPNTPIPESILRRVADDPEALGEAVGELVGLGLLKEGPAIHPLLAEFARALAPTLKRREEEVRSFLSALADLAEATHSEVDRTGNYALYAPLLPHIRAAASHAEALDPPTAGRLWNSLGYHLYVLADYHGARAVYEQALKINETIFSHNDLNVVRNLTHNLRGLGLVLGNLGDLEGSRACLQRALRIDKVVFGHKHPHVARDLYYLGLVLRDMRKLQEARSCKDLCVRVRV